MEPFENTGFEPEAEIPQPIQPEPIPPQPEPAPYHGTGTGRKESPYANSPYVMDHQPQQPPQYHYQPQTEPPRKPQKVKKPRKPIWKPLLSGILVLALIATGCGITAACVNEAWEDEVERMEQKMNDRIAQLEEKLGKSGSGSIAATVPTGTYMTPSQVYASCVDSVVAISSTIKSTSFYGTSTGSSSGSGFILTEDGYVITNYHVVEGAVSIEVITHAGEKYSAELVGNDATNDVAVLKVDATGLPAATLGRSSDLIIGDMVAAIGNPLGTLASTQTVGYVSGINREVTTDNTIISMIQTDAAINSGNSGGPLFNMYGQVIGITTAKYSGTTGSGATIEGIGFAIPIDDVVPVINDLIDYGYVTGAYLGVTVRIFEDGVMEQYGLAEGAYIESVEQGGAAHRAGIQAKDVIIDLGGYPITSYNDLSRALRNFKAGDTTTVTLLRNGREMSLSITLDEKPHETTGNVPESDPAMPSEGNPEEWYDYYFRRFFGD